MVRLLMSRNAIKINADSVKVIKITKSMSKFYRPDNQYFMNLTSKLFIYLAR